MADALIRRHQNPRGPGVGCVSHQDRRGLSFAQDSARGSAPRKTLRPSSPWLIPTALIGMSRMSSANGKSTRVDGSGQADLCVIAAAVAVGLTGIVAPAAVVGLCTTDAPATGDAAEIDVVPCSRRRRCGRPEEALWAASFGACGDGLADGYDCILTAWAEDGSLWVGFRALA